MFRIEGIKDGVTTAVTWNDGKIEGRLYDIAQITLLADIKEGSGGVEATPTGPFFKKNLLKEPLAALRIIEEYFDQVTKAEGDLPEEEYNFEHIY